MEEQSEQISRAGFPRGARLLVLPMLGLQLLWIGSIWVTGLPPNWPKLRVLALYSFAAAIALALLPDRVLRPVERARHAIAKRPWLAAAALGVGAIGSAAATAVYQQTILPDEQYHLYAGGLLAEKGLATFFEAYPHLTWISENHPPLVPVLHGISIALLRSHVLVIRLLSVAFGAGTVSLTYLLGRSLYDCETGFLGALWLLSMPLVLRVAGAATTDIPATFFILLALLLLVRLSHVGSFITSIALGIVIGVGCLTKYTMVFVFPIVGVWVLVDRPFKESIAYIGVALAVAAVIVAPWISYLHHTGMIAKQLHAVAGHASQVTRTRSGRKWLLQALMWRLPPSLGTYNLPWAIAGAIAAIRSRSRSSVLLLLWIGVVSLPLLPTLPDPRYFVPSFPALAILIARGSLAVSALPERLLILALSYCAGVVYVSGDWEGVAQLFLR